MSHACNLSAARIACHADKAVSVLIGDKRPDIVILCEHGGREIPSDWEGLGLPEAFLETHYSHDIGSRKLTLRVAQRLGATSVVANYSRLFLDYNRKAGDPSCIRPDMGGIPIPGNIRISGDERSLRERIARYPVEKALAGLLEGEQPVGRMVISIHSFSPVWETSYRSCEIGVMWKRDERMSAPLIRALQEQARFRVEDNQPYSFAESDWFTLDRHGLSIGVPNAYIEIRNDLIETDQSVDDMAVVVAGGIEKAATELGR